MNDNDTDSGNNHVIINNLKQQIASLKLHLDDLLAERENALIALGYHPETQDVDLAAEINRIRNEGRAYFHEISRLRDSNFELERINLEMALIAEEEKGVEA